MHIFDRIRDVFPLVAALLLILPAPAYPGQLEDFEKDATTPHQERPRPTTVSTTEKKSSTNGLSSDAGDEFVAELFVDIVEVVFYGVAALLAEGGSQSWERIGVNETGAKVGTGSRESGDALLPSIRLDALYQNVEGDVSATDVRLELGHGPLGAQVRRTVYDEKDPLASMEVTQYYLLYRMSAGDYWEIDLGLGGMALSGLQHNSGVSAVVPVLFHPSESFGIEIRPAWSSINENSIQDLDVAVVLGMRYVSIKAGYRSMRSPHQSLRGPEIGLAMRW